METGMLHLHSVLRYLILAAALWSIFQMASGLNGKKVFTKSDKRPALLFMILMDLQLLVGLYLYFFLPNGIKKISQVGMGPVMEDKVSRFFAIEHLLGMAIALILVHIGYAVTKKPIEDSKKFKRAFWMFLIALVLMLAFIPWPFRELGRGWMPGM